MLTSKKRARVAAFKRRSGVLTEFAKSSSLWSFVGLAGATGSIYIAGMVWCNLNTGSSLEQQTSWLLAAVGGWALGQIMPLVFRGDPFHMQAGLVMALAALGALLVGPAPTPSWMFYTALALLSIGALHSLWHSHRYHSQWEGEPRKEVFRGS